MIIVIIILSILVIICLSLYILEIIEIKRLTKELKILNDENREQIITVSYPTKTNKKLVSEMNRIILKKQHEKQETKKKTNDLQDMISNIAHDMKTPLTAILGYTNLLNNNKLRKEEKKKYLNIIERRSTALQKLILDFYDISRLDNDEYQLEIKKIDINKLCLETIAENYNELESNNIEVNIKIGDKPVYVMADEFAIKRVFENLIQNVKKYGKDKFFIKSYENGKDYIFEFANISSDINDKVIEKVFNRAFTNDKTRQNGSSGLGLTIVKSLVEKMGHQVIAEYKDNMFIIKIIFIER